MPGCTHACIHACVRQERAGPLQYLTRWYSCRVPVVEKKEARDAPLGRQAGSSLFDTPCFYLGVLFFLLQFSNASEFCRLGLRTHEFALFSHLGLQTCSTSDPDPSQIRPRPDPDPIQRLNPGLIQIGNRPDLDPAPIQIRFSSDPDVMQNRSRSDPDPGSSQIRSRSGPIRFSFNADSTQMRCRSEPSWIQIRSRSDLESIESRCRFIKSNLDPIQMKIPSKSHSDTI